MHSFLKFIFGIGLYMFRTVSLSITRGLALYTQQQVQVIQVMLTACQQAVSITCMTYTYCCVYSARPLMMDRDIVRNLYSPIPKINSRNQGFSLVLLYEYITIQGPQNVKLVRLSKCYFVPLHFWLWLCRSARDMIPLFRMPLEDISDPFPKYVKHPFSM